MGAVRKRIFFSGRVQGVGFRWTVRSVASGYTISGYVQNLNDGRVEVIAEGEDGEVSTFISAVKDRMRGYISHVDMRKEQPKGENTGFEIRV